MKTILTVVIISVLICIALFTANYYTLFGYYLPHKGQLVEMRPGDIAVTSHFGGFITIPNNSGVWEFGDVVIANESQNSTIGERGEKCLK